MPEPETTKPPLWTSIWLLVILCVAWCVLFMLLSVTHAIPTRVLAYFGIAMFAGLWLFGYFQFKEKKKYPPPPELSDPVRIRKSIRTFRNGIILYSFALLYGEFAIQHQSPWVRIAGAAFDLGLIALFIKAIRKLQHKLKKLQ